MHPAQIKSDLIMQYNEKLQYNQTTLPLQRQESMNKEKKLWKMRSWRGLLLTVSPWAPSSQSVITIIIFIVSPACFISSKFYLPARDDDVAQDDSINVFWLADAHVRIHCNCCLWQLLLPQPPLSHLLVYCVCVCSSNTRNLEPTNQGRCGCRPRQ